MVLAMLLGGISGGVTVRSLDTILSVQADEHGVILRKLSNSDHTANWANGSSRLLLPSSASVRGHTVSLRWNLASKTSGATFLFTCPSPKLIVISHWKGSRLPGPIEHELTIVNGTSEAIRLPRLESLSWTLSTKGRRLESWWVEKGAGRPTDVGVHRSSIKDGFAENLVSTPYSDDTKRDPIPWISVYDAQAKGGWYGGIEFSGRTQIALQSQGGEVNASMGLAEDETASPFPTMLQPRESHPYPVAFVGCFRGSVDDGSNRLRRWVDQAIRPKTTDPRYPLLTLNSWGSGMAIDAGLGRSMMRDAHKLGLEMFHVDAGWFRGVGDWRANLSKFPKGIGSLADEAHRLKLKFGLWTGWTQGGLNPDGEDRQEILNVRAPDRADWFARDYPADWKPAEYSGADLCLGDPRAAKWCTNLLLRMVGENRLDMLEHDQRMVLDQCARTDHLHNESPTDISYRAANGYYSVYDAVRAKYPDLLFENCVNGGRMVDLGAARRAHYFSITDAYDPLANRRAFWDASYVLPPSMCECYVQEMPVKTLPEFKSMLRSGLMGWFTLMQNPAKWSPEQYRAAQEEFVTYKTKLRPLIRSGNLYHVSTRPDGVHWDGVQYVSRDGTRGVLYAFRGSAGEGTHRFSLHGLSPSGRYRLHFQDGGAADRVVSAQALLSSGVLVGLKSPGTSQMVFLNRI